METLQERWRKGMIYKRKIVLAALLALVLLLLLPLASAKLNVTVTESFKAILERPAGLVENATILSYQVNGTIEIKNEGPDRLADIWVPIFMDKARYDYLAVNTTATPAYANVTLFSTVPDYAPGRIKALNPDYVVHINALNVSDSVVLRYGTTNAKYGDIYIFTIGESFNRTRVLAGRSYDVRETIKICVNSSWSGQIGFYVKKIYNQSSAYLLQPTYTVSRGLATVGTTANITSPLGWEWRNATDKYFFLQPGDSAEAWFVFRINATVPGATGEGVYAERFMFGRLYVEMKLFDTITNISIGNASAVGPAVIEAKKETIGVKTFGDGTTVYEYNISAAIKNNATALFYNVTYYAVWASNASQASVQGPNAPAIGYGTPNGTLTSYSYTASAIAVVLGPGDRLEVPSGGRQFWVNETQVPVVWALFNFTITGDQTDQHYSALTPLDANGNSTAYVLEYIYVIKGYLIRVTKIVRPIDGQPNNYTVNISVCNEGPTDSPEIYVYDLVPTPFTYYDPVPTPYATQAVTGRYNGTVLIWKYATIPGGQCEKISYVLHGPSDQLYRLSKAFIIGVDPVFCEGTQSIPRITGEARFGGSNGERWLALVALGLWISVGAVVVRRRS